MQQNTTQPSDHQTEDWLRLCLVSGVGPRILTALIAHFETPGAVLAAGTTQLQTGRGRRISFGSSDLVGETKNRPRERIR